MQHTAASQNIRQAPVLEKLFVQGLEDGSEVDKVPPHFCGVYVGVRIDHIPDRLPNLAQD